MRLSNDEPDAEMRRAKRRGALQRLSACLGLALICAGLFGCATIPPPRAGWNLMAPGAPKAGDRSAFNVSVYDNVWNWVRGHYYDPGMNGADWRAAGNRHRPAAAAAKDDTELYAAINAMLDELHDRHTHATSAAEFARTFGHRGVVVGIRSEPVRAATDGRRRIVEVFPGGAAEEAGVRRGWILLSCDGRPPAEVLGPGKLQDGQVVHCEFLTAEGERRALELRGKRMSYPTFRSARLVDGTILLVQFEEFDMPTAAWLRQTILDHPAAKGLILDLRGNGGGHLFALAAILADVFPKPVSMGEMVHRGRSARWYRSIPQTDGAHYSGPVAVLVSKYTASAAEIFSQILKEHGRATIIGEKTAGATLTSVFWPLRGGGKLQLSVYNYHSPEGRRLEGNGVLPDIEVPGTEPTSADAEDPALQAALRVFTSETHEVPAAPELHR